MESEIFSDEPAPVRRKPRARSRKTSPADENPAAEPVLEEIAEFNQSEEILELPGEQDESRKPGTLAHMDLAPLVMAAAFVLFLFAQVLSLRQAAAALTWQNQNLGLQVERLRSLRENASKLVLERQNVVDQSQRVSTSYNELLVGLIKLAETDKDARSVVEKFNIKSVGASEISSPNDGKK